MEAPLTYGGKVVGTATMDKDGKIECFLNDTPLANEIKEKVIGPISFGFSYPKPDDDYKETSISIDFP